MLSTSLKSCATAAMLMGLLVLSGCDHAGAQNAQAAPARPPAMVTAVPAVSHDVPVFLDEIGRIVAVDVVSIVPQVGGKVVATHVDDGAYVKKGDLLFEIDPRPFEASLAAAKASEAQGEAELTWAKADFKRTEEMMPSSAASQIEYDEKKSKLGVAAAKIDLAKADIQTAELNLEYCKIYSTIDGRAGARLVDAGNVVKANEGTMLVIQRLDPIYAEFTVTENDLGTVRKFMSTHGMQNNDPTNLGLKALVDVPGDSAQVLAALNSVATQPANVKQEPREGKLTFLDNAVASGGTVKLRATVGNADHYFWPGLFVNVRLILTTKKDAVLIPAQAQQIGQQGPYVYVVTPDGSAEQRAIVTGQRQDDLLVVESGVKAGEQVIVTGQMMVQPGGKVMITNQQQQPQTAQR